jgi:hypothetical protein
MGVLEDHGDAAEDAELDETLERSDARAFERRVVPIIGGFGCSSSKYSMMASDSGR